MAATSYFLHINTPVDTLELEASDTHLLAIRFSSFKQKTEKMPSTHQILNNTKLQLKEYFKGKRNQFDLPLRAEGTSFEQDVWQQLCHINYGSTITYSELAKRLGDINKVRAVGRANGSNPLPIVIPCHRVIGVNNKLVGYGGGIENKRWLLQHEGALLL